MKYKRIFQRQVHRLQEIAMPASLIMLSLNLALTSYQYIQWRDFNPYLTIVTLFTIIIGVLLLLANVYVRVLKMHVAKKRAIIEHDPTQVYAFTPFQSMLSLEFQVPLLRSLGHDKQADRLERWAEQGFIDKEDFHENLQIYYKEKGDRV